jgi:hypothetical protein
MELPLLLSVTGKRGAVARIVRGVVDRGQRCEPDEVHESEPNQQCQAANERSILRQGR